MFAQSVSFSCSCESEFIRMINVGAKSRRATEERTKIEEKDSEKIPYVRWKKNPKSEIRWPRILHAKYKHHARIAHRKAANHHSKSNKKSIIDGDVMSIPGYCTKFNNKIVIFSINIDTRMVKVQANGNEKFTLNMMPSTIVKIIVIVQLPTICKNRRPLMTLRYRESWIDNWSGWYLSWSTILIVFRTAAKNVRIMTWMRNIINCCSLIFAPSLPRIAW